jgi:hypothetical protein
VTGTSYLNRGGTNLFPINASDGLTGLGGDITMTSGDVTTTGYIGGTTGLFTGGIQGQNIIATGSVRGVTGLYSAGIQGTTGVFSGVLVNGNNVDNQAQSLNAQTGTTYTLVSADAGKMVTLSNASAITLTLPTSVGSVGQRIDITQLGAGQVTITASGTTLRAATGLKLRAQYSSASLVQIASNEWLVVGDTAA